MNPLNKPILLVEDNPMDVDLTCRVLRKHALTHEIVVARDGEEAIQLVEAWQPHTPTPAVILLDLKLPRLNGLEVLERLRRHARFGSVPVVVLTTSTESEDMQKAYALGANSYIVKPVDFDEFLNVATQIEQYWLSLNQFPH